MRLCWLAVLLALAAAPAAAKRIWKHVDENGVTHYTDRAPEDPAAATEIAVRAERQQIARLRLEGGSDARRALVYNALAGPIEVQLRFAQAEHVVANPALPLRQVVAANSEPLLTVIGPAEGARRAAFRLEMTAVPGDPGAVPEDVEYALPVPSGSGWRIDQGYGGSFSHTDDQSRHAIDINVPEGTPVLAARGGVVMQVEDDFEGSGLDREKFGGRANHVRVLHADGTMAVYAHLGPESVRVRAGQKISAGQQIGASGNTGFSTGPHLHFALQVNRGMELVSIPFRMGSDQGSVAIPGA